MSGPESHPAKPICVVVPDSRRYRRIATRYIHLKEDMHLVVEVQGEGFSFARVVFWYVKGYRVLDEAALLEFWSEYSEPNGWLWEVKSGGWLDLERTRPDSRYWLGNDQPMPLREFFLVDDKCVSVICTHTPEIQDLGADPLDPL